MYYANSISALQQLLFSGPPSPNSEEEQEGEAGEIAITTNAVF